jgi:hypothetical protein
MTFPDKDDITWGGFIKSNVKNALINDCLSSGDPHNMFRALEDAIEDIRDEINDTDADSFWEKEMEGWRIE